MRACGGLPENTLSRGAAAGPREWGRRSLNAKSEGVKAQEVWEGNFLTWRTKSERMGVHRGEPCPQFFPKRRRVSLCGAAPFDAPQHNSFLLALLNQSQRPAPLPRAKPGGVRQVWKGQQRIAPRRNFRLPMRHWWALLALLLKPRRRIRSGSLWRSRSISFCR